MSVITLTFGRPQHLEEAIESFLRQDYADKRMVVLNSCVEQTLTGDFPNVKIINLKERPKNLGAARNLAIEACEPGLICVLDDDDLALPHMLSVYAKHLATTPGAQWVFADKQVYLEGGKVKKITNGMANTLAFTKDAWRRVGGYNSLTVGEDRAIVGKITASEPGVKASIENAEISYLYAWGQGNSTYHVSGLGDDQHNRVPAWERSRLDLESKLRRGIVKSGTITLKPAWKQDYTAIVRDFLLEQQKHGAPGLILKASGVRALHAVERHEEPPDKRKEQARASWDALYDQGVVACHYSQYERDATGIGDARALPYLKDVLAFALKQAEVLDIVFLTNDDNILHPRLADALAAHVLRYGPVCSQRCEFRTEPPKPSEPPEKFASLGRPHMGRDLFAATKAWWKAHWEEIPDYIFGASSWDLGMASLFRLHHGIRSTRKNLEKIMPPAELARGYVSHQFHVPKWAVAENLKSAPSERWNHERFRDWAAKHLPELKFHPGGNI